MMPAKKVLIGPLLVPSRRAVTWTACGWAVVAANVFVAGFHCPMWMSAAAIWMGTLPALFRAATLVTAFWTRARSPALST